MAERRRYDLGLLIGRVLMGLVFVLMAYAKFHNMAGTVAFLGDIGLPSPETFAWVSVVVEGVCGVCLLLGIMPEVAALVLAVYLVPATFTFHLTGEADQLEHFYKNLAVIGGLLAYWGLGGGSKFRLLG